MQSIFLPLHNEKWGGIAPFRLGDSQGFQDFETPVLKAGWYSLSMALVLNELSAERPPETNWPNLIMEVQYNTEGSKDHEEGIVPRRTSQWRRLGLDCDGGEWIKMTCDWPWGSFQNVFHMTKDDAAIFTVSLQSEQKSNVGYNLPGFFVGGFVRLLLKQEA